jgi:hypothetical protein
MIVILAQIVAQAVGLRLPTAAAALVRSSVRCDLWLKKLQWGGFSLYTSVSPAISFTNGCISINHPILDI